MALVAGFAVLAGTLSAQSTEQRSRPQPRTGPAERSLLGISLFDPGTKVIARYGNPDAIQALNIGGGGGGGGAAGGAGGGRPGPAAPAGGGGPAGGSGMAGPMAQPGRANAPLDGFIGDPFGETVRQRGPGGVGSGGPPAGFRPPQGPPGGAGRGGPGAGSMDGDEGGGGPGRGAAGSGGGAGAGVGAGAGATDRVTVTRWVYNRGMARYAFILDKFNRVIQIEAVGMNDSRVRTSRGIKFGSSFGSIIKTYKSPDGYEISGNNIVMRYLVFDRVAFRLQKVDPKKPHVVTGIVIAAGKT